MNNNYLTFTEAAKKFGRKCGKTIRRWIQKRSGFPQPVFLGAWPVLIEEEVDAYIEKLKEDRKKRRSK
jgi:predicted DNA-binding transcriptional regulator AlpA